MNFSRGELDLINQYASNSKETTLNDLRQLIQFVPNHPYHERLIEIADKLDAMPEGECIQFMQDLRKEYNRKNEESIRRKLAQAKADAESEQAPIRGQDLYANERFMLGTRYMIVANIRNDQSPVGLPGERHRLFLSDIGYQNALESEKRGEIKITQKATVSKGQLHYITPSIQNER